MRLFLSLDNPKNAQINDETEQFGADEADSLVLCCFVLAAIFQFIILLSYMYVDCMH